MDTKQTSCADKNNDNLPEAGRFRQILPQIIACTVKNFLLLNLGLTMAMPTIIVPALLGLNTEKNPNEIIHITPKEASWLASIGFIVVPIGSLLSGWVTEPIGRKRSFFFVNVPHLLSWILLYRSTTYTHVFWAQILTGFGHGLMEAPLVTYIGEIVEPSIRGVLMAVSGIAGGLGFLIVYFLGSITEWRNVALYCIFIPVFTMVGVCFIPETPLWLLSKNRPEDARKSLQWLRGWVTPQAVEKEFSELQRHSAFTKTCAACYKTDQKCIHPPATAVEKLRGLLLPNTLKPLGVLLIIYTLGQLSGTYAMRSYFILIFKAYGTPLSPSNATTLLAFVGILGTTTCVCIIKFVGKRKLFLIALFVVSIPKIALGIYGFMTLPPGTTSFFPDEGVEPRTGNYFPLIAFVLMQFINSVGVSSVPHMLFSELLPYKTRGIATGLAAAINYVVSFTMTKTYYDLEMIFSLPGTIMFYGVMCLTAASITFFIIPETEKRSLEDIEMHFSDKRRSFFDRNIQINGAGIDSKNQTISIKA